MGDGGRRRRVLLVEDEVDAARVFGRLLQVCGYDVETVHSGLDAVPTAEQFRPDCVVCDIRLPGQDGYEVARHFRKHPFLDRIPLVALTAFGERSEAEAAGFDRHLMKPTGVWMLIGVLREILGEREVAPE